MTQCFGNISSGKMILSNSGNIANQKLLELTEHFSFVSLDEYVVMPNHVHLIVIINPQSGIVDTLQPTVDTLQPTVDTLQPTVDTLQSTVDTLQPTVETLHATSLQY
jgi:hypothetical protein